MSARFEIPTPKWHLRAACRGVADPEIFFPEKTTGSRSEATKYCMACPVRATCEADATTMNEQFGIWGGKTPSARRRERKRLRRDDAAAAA